ncbi:hypothetical protein [Streptomyces sp. NPDC085529]|uniref:hypothetical protein n=1 Tax=Streptomyces sp. NPDC085529 TaxID=3365729 RepID=UPI0037D939C5
MPIAPFNRRKGMTRRSVLRAALATGAAVPLAAFAGPAWADPGAVAPTTTRLTLPEPTGPHPVGTVQLHLVDRSRPDYPLAFFDEHLRRRRAHLLDGPTPAFPAVTFLS